MYENAKDLFEKFRSLCDQQNFYLTEADYSALDGPISTIKVFAQYSHPLKLPKGRITNREVVRIHLNALEGQVWVHTSAMRETAKGRRVQEALVRGVSKLSELGEGSYSIVGDRYVGMAYLKPPAEELYDEEVDLEVRLRPPAGSVDFEPEDCDLVIVEKPSLDAVVASSHEDEETTQMINESIQY